MDFTQLTLSQIATAITVVGVICGFLFKLFSIFTQVKNNKNDIEKFRSELTQVQYNNRTQKEELLRKVEQTNEAVNLLCSAISAMIDNELNDNKNKDELRVMKHRLDEKKEIV